MRFMLDFSTTELTKVVAHSLGVNANTTVISNAELDISDSLLVGLLREYFFGSFRNQGFYSFEHSSNLELNEMYSYCSSYFDGNISFIDFSQGVAKHLQHVSAHPNIKDGELFVTAFTDTVVDGELADGIGIFKVESKERFLLVNRENNILRLTCQFGVTPRKIDKACLIFNTEKELGYKLCVIDNTNRDEAKYWINDFLRAKLRNDEFYQTRQTINLCREFVEEVVKPENNFAKVDQADILCKTRDFFKANDVFNLKEFEEVVLEEPKMAEEFRSFKQKYEEAIGCNIPDSFKISTDATRQSQKFFKSVIKLDKNFHIYIHGNRERVERGFDPDTGMNFYKLYFDKES